VKATTPQGNILELILLASGTKFSPLYLLDQKNGFTGCCGAQKSGCDSLRWEP
jgi:hypothetical protein